MRAPHYPDSVNNAAVYCDRAAGAFQPERPTLVLVHGALNDHSVWSRQTTELARRCNVLVPDLPGHGRSAGAPLQTVEEMADWLLAFLDAAGVAHATLAGHSMGSLIALEAAFRQPARVERLVLLGSTWPMKVSPALLEMTQSDQAGAIGSVATWSHAVAPDGAGAELVADAVALMERLAAASPVNLLYNDLHACHAYANGENAARSIVCPVTLVVGSADRMTPPKSTTRLREALPHARTVEVACGHQMMAEQPGAVLAALQEAVGAA